MRYKCGFQVEGVVTDARELKTKDGSKTWAHQLSVASIGITVELRVDEHVWKKFSGGDEVRATGRFDLFNGRIQMIADDVSHLHGADGEQANLKNDKKPGSKAA